MRFPLLPTLFLTVALSTSCSQAQPNEDSRTEEPSTVQQGKKGGKKSDKKKGKIATLEEAVVGLRHVGSMKGLVPESSGLALTGEPNTFYTHGDDGNTPIIYKITAEGKLLDQIELSEPNNDWESLARDNQGIIYVGNCGNNNNDRRDLSIYRVDMRTPRQVGKIKFSYPDQTAFPPPKKERNFDCEATLWHDGQLYLFTKDRGQQRTSKVYSLPDKPGTYQAKRVTELAIPGMVTDANLSPNGRRLVLMAREEMYVYQGASFAAILKATPERIPLPKAGQTEGVVFIDDNTLLISTEQGDLYKYSFE